jgi:hypothetical protein
LPPPEVRVPGERPGEFVPLPPSGRREPPPRGDDGFGPSEPPERPTGRPEPRPDDLVFEVDPRAGSVHPVPEGEDRLVVVMRGNPRLRGFAHTRPDGSRVPPFTLKANTIVAWIDRKHSRVMDVFRGLGRNGEAAPPPAEDDDRDVAWVLQDAVLGLYAEGAAELVFGDLAWRSDQLYVEPRTFKALFIEPQFDGNAYGADTEGERLPLHIRARRMRVVAKGTAVFDDAQVSTDRASDAFTLEVRRLTVEELDEEMEATGPRTDFLGFRSISAQTYRAQGTVLRGERVPLLYWPDAEFGLPEGESFPVRFKGADWGQRSSWGIFGFVGVGAPLGPSDDPILDWIVNVGGYTERGPAAWLDLLWEHRIARGRARGWGVWDFDGEDRNGFMASETYRWLVEFENRSILSDRLSVDAEFNTFADRGVNLEFFEADQLQHKNRESYVRPRYEYETLVTTLTAKWHQRDFVTETTELPQLAIWGTSIPLYVPPTRGGPAVDLSTVTQGGYLERRFDDVLATPDYAAWRMLTDTRVNLSFDVGDLRFTSFAGTGLSSYQNRTDGPDVNRAALLAGGNANLQIHRDWNARGGIFQLDRLRHVVDLDAGYFGRFFDTASPDEVPFFDRFEYERERSQINVRMRNRLQTRDAESGGLRNLMDLELSYEGYMDDEGPFLQTAPGIFQAVGVGQPRRGFYLAGELLVDLDGYQVDRSFLSAGAKPLPTLAVFTGIRYVRHVSAAPIVDLSWRWSEKYGLRFLESYDFRTNENRARLVFRRHGPDHIWVFGVNQRGDEFGVTLNFEPTIGGGPRGELGVGGALSGFNDEPDLDPWGAFP